MDNNDTNVSVQFIGDGICREFNFTFQIFSIGKVEVYIGDDVQESGYSISRDINNSGGSVIFDNAPKSGVVITLIRVLPIQRTTDFTEGGPFRASKVNLEFDYQIACIEQVSEKLNRVISQPPYLGGQLNLTLPPPESGKSLVWNSDGTALKNSDISFDEVGKAYDAANKLFEDASQSLESITEQTAKIDTFVSSIDGIEQQISNIENALESAGQVIESYVTEDGSWYCKYKNGWIEQGGKFTGSITSRTINFLTPFENKPLFFSMSAGSSSGNSGNPVVTASTTTAFTCSAGIYSAGNLPEAVYWEAKGY